MQVNRARGLSPGISASWLRPQILLRPRSLHVQPLRRAQRPAKRLRGNWRAPAATTPAGRHVALELLLGLVDDVVLAGVFPDAQSEGLAGTDLGHVGMVDFH